MGIATGYHLEIAGADVTFLVRPHRVAALKRPQVLYSYDDNRLKNYTNYTVLSDPAALSNQRYDFIVVTLDGASLKDPHGVELVRLLGRLFKTARTKIIIGTIGVSLRPWFIRESGLMPEHVVSGSLGIQCYAPTAVRLPAHLSTDTELLGQADLAYRHCWPFGFSVDDRAREAAQAFAELYSASKVSTCIIETTEEKEVLITSFFVQLAAFDIAGWPSPLDMDANSELWLLATQATIEIQSLPGFGAAGLKAIEQTSAASILKFWCDWERDMLPLDLQAFNKYHHGGKVNRQDLQILSDCIALGESAEQMMPATRELLKRQAALKV